MTLDDRIEAAAEAAKNYGYAISYEMPELLLRAAFPELFSDPPTAWLAPWEATKTMRKAGDDALLARDGWVFARVLFNEMRDAHRLSQVGEK